MASPALATVSRETVERLAAYVALLQKWNSRINLIGKSTEQEIWERHVADSLQLLPLLPPPPCALADLGSGAGLPGLVIAIARPDMAVTLVEQDQRKAAFLREVVAQMALKNTQVCAENIDTIQAVFQVVTARALASLSTLCAYAYPRLAENAICLFPKGKNFAMELEEACSDWQFEHHVHPSQTARDSALLLLRHLKPREYHA